MSTSERPIVESRFTKYALWSALVLGGGILVGAVISPSGRYQPPPEPKHEPKREIKARATIDSEFHRAAVKLGGQVLGYLHTHPNKVDVSPYQVDSREATISLETKNRRTGALYSISIDMATQRGDATKRSPYNTASANTVLVTQSAPGVSTPNTVSFAYEGWDAGGYLVLNGNDTGPGYNYPVHFHNDLAPIIDTNLQNAQNLLTDLNLLEKQTFNGHLNP